MIRDIIFDPANLLIADRLKLEILSGECILCTLLYVPGFQDAFPIRPLGAALGERKLGQEDLITPKCTGCYRVTSDLLWLLLCAVGSGGRWGLGESRGSRIRPPYCYITITENTVEGGVGV